MKKCSKCGEVKELGEFWKDRTRKNGHSMICKKCDAIRCKKYRGKNKIEINSRRRKYREENREKLNLIHKGYYEKNKNKIDLRNNKYRKENRVKLNNEIYFINTAPEELKPALITILTLRKKKNLLKELQNGRTKNNAVCSN